MRGMKKVPLGGGIGTIVHSLWPAATGTPGAYALVGMGAVVAGATHAPITAILIIFELTGDYEIILPVMTAVVTASVAAISARIWAISNSMRSSSSCSRFLFISP